MCAGGSEGRDSDAVVKVTQPNFLCHGCGIQNCEIMRKLCTNQNSDPQLIPKFLKVAVKELGRATTAVSQQPVAASFGIVCRASSASVLSMLGFYVIEEICSTVWGVGGTVARESALRVRSAKTPLLRVRAPLQAPWPDRGL
ncbi:hypothetical protein PoB_003404500 [Plakobranchus ocellatus]|uniref:Uncharacterized protein n=1 Tax=Plakobranchus ocellatus TaxID=259542 RepID=A0AAV4AH89_9GAST|nr:hypothetical protein PoB_003404500 [Plakobranchus ocellatus]